jgi:hypothetical protein
VFGTGGTSVSGEGGVGVQGLGGVGAGGGHGVLGIGAGSTFTPIVVRAGGAFKAGTGASTIGAYAEASAGSIAAFWAAGHATGGPAIVATALGPNDSIRADSLNGDGYAVWARAKIAAPVRSPIHIDPQDALPSVAQSGDIQFGTNAHASGGRMLAYQTAPFGVGTWQAVTTNLTRESIKAFASVTVNAGVITVHKAYNLTFSIVGAGAASRLRCTFGFPFASAFDYQPQSTPVSVAAQDRYPVIAQVDVGFFDIALYDISANAYQQLDGAGGANFTFRISVSGAYD